MGSRPMKKSNNAMLLFQSRLIDSKNIRKRDFYKEKQILLEEGTSIKGRKSYFEKRLVLREESLMLRRDFYEEKTVLF